MLYFVMLLLGFAGGGVCVFLLVMQKLQAVRKQQESLERRQAEYRMQRDALNQSLHEFMENKQLLADEQIAFRQRVVTYDELRAENTTLKHDLQNNDVARRKLEMDVIKQAENQENISDKVDELGKRYLKENIKWIGRSLTPNNFAAMKKRLLDVIARCRAVGFPISDSDEAEYVAELKADFEKAVRAEFEKQEQARIKAQIREEQQLERETQRELDQVERERKAIEAALEKALADAADEHSEEVQRLRERLAEAEAKSPRAMSRAQMTRSGHVYVISNIGSFGNDVFKIGMTRRLEPMDRVKELGDASVPFAFDVHMMISCDDAPALENALHRALHTSRLNKVNFRKEFFRSDIDQIREIVESNHGKVEYVADPEALEYHQSEDMTLEDQEYLETVHASLGSDDSGFDSD